MHRTQGWPFLRRFLHPVLAEAALASGDQRGNALGGMRLADGDQRHLAWLAPRQARSGGDARGDFSEAGGWLFHRALL